MAALVAAAVILEDRLLSLRDRRTEPPIKLPPLSPPGVPPLVLMADMLRSVWGVMPLGDWGMPLRDCGTPLSD